MRFEGDEFLVVATRQPRELAARIARAAVEDRVAIGEVAAGDRSLEGIFGRLVRLHRGVGS
jgi:GGDEF domain-containing protein